jgi:toxin CcdB
VAQFEVYKTTDGALVCDLQTDLIDVRSTRVVAPLAHESDLGTASNLTPAVMFEGRPWVVLIPLMAAVPRNRLSDPLASLSPHRDAIKRAIDMLIDGV